MFAMSGVMVGCLMVAFVVVMLALGHLIASRMKPLDPEQDAGLPQHNSSQRSLK